MFKTKRSDGRSLRVIAFDLLKTKSPDDVCSYQELGNLLGLNPKRERSVIQAVVRSANKALLKLHQKGVEITDQGYRIVQPREHMLVANGHQNKADRALARALRWYENTDLSSLTEIERKLHQGQHMLARAIFASHQHLDRRIKRLENVLEAKVVEH
jgi:hypothetical protein